MVSGLEAGGHQHVIVHTGQRDEANVSDAFFADLKIPAPDVCLGIGSGSHGAQTDAMLAALEPVLSTQDPALPSAEDLR